MLCLYIFNISYDFHILFHIDFIFILYFHGNAQLWPMGAMRILQKAGLSAEKLWLVGVPEHPSRCLRPPGWCAGQCRVTSHAGCVGWVVRWLLLQVFLAGRVTSVTHPWTPPVSLRVWLAGLVQVGRDTLYIVICGNMWKSMKSMKNTWKSKNIIGNHMKTH